MSGPPNHSKHKNRQLASSSFPFTQLWYPLFPLSFTQVLLIPCSHQFYSLLPHTKTTACYLSLHPPFSHPRHSHRPWLFETPRNQRPPTTYRLQTPKQPLPFSSHPNSLFSPNRAALLLPQIPPPSLSVSFLYDMHNLLQPALHSTSNFVLQALPCHFPLTSSLSPVSCSLDENPNEASASTPSFFSSVDNKLVN